MFYCDFTIVVVGLINQSELKLRPRVRDTKFHEQLEISQLKV